MKKLLVVLALLPNLALAQAQNLYIDEADSSIISASGKTLKLGSTSTQGVQFNVNSVTELTLGAAAFALPTNYLAIGASTLPTDVGTTDKIYVFGVKDLSLAQGVNDANGPILSFYKSDATDGSADAAADSGDDLGELKFYGADGADFQAAASILVEADAATGAGDMPGRITFKVSADGAAAPAEALKIDNTKLVTAANGITVTAGGLTVTAGGETITAGGLTINGGGLLYGAALMETGAAAGNSAGTALALSATKFIHLASGADETTGVKLPACAAADIGKIHFIMNSVANKFMVIWPDGTDNIDGLGAGAQYNTGAAGEGRSTTMCVCQAAGVWYCG